MTREEIVDAAARTGLVLSRGAMTPLPEYIERLVNFAALIADAEREACAQVAEQTVCDEHLPTGVKIYGGRAAKAIRARREKR